MPLVFQKEAAMKYVQLLAATALAIVLTACDQVRLPGAGEPAAPEQVEASEIEAEPVQVSDIPEAESETPTVDRDDAAIPDTQAPPATVTETLPAPNGGLALLNAARCAQPVETAPTPTVASVAGATELEEPLVGAEAVNALAATLAAFPGIVKIEPRKAMGDGRVSVGHCSAVRVRANWFVTAAHCVDQPYDEIRIIGDTANLRSPAAHITRATRAICHAGYLGTDNAYSNDIALVWLTPEEAAPLVNVPVARAASTGQPLAPANYPNVDMAGWGLTRFGGQLSNDLLSAALDLKAVGPAAITVASRGGAGPCVGDSGGPLFVTEADGSRTVVGVLSVVEQNKATGQFCAGDYNGRYTNLQGFAGWIDSVIALCEATPDACT